MSDTQQRIDELVKGNDITLFMKGSASFPMCGFRAARCKCSKLAAWTPRPSKL